MAFFSEVKVYKGIVRLSFDFLQFLGLIHIESWRSITL